MDRILVTITDEQTNISYKITVSKEQYERASRDSEYFDQLLMEAKMANNRPSTSGTDKNLASPLVNNLVNTPDRNLFELEDSENDPLTSRRFCSVWGYEQTLCLINSMALYINDFNDPRKRKFVFEHIANDLISAGFTVDAKSVGIKWKGLLRSYNRTKDLKNKTGQGPSRFLFFEAIDEIVGKKPKNSCGHSISSLEMIARPVENNDLDYLHELNEGNLDQNIPTVDENLPVLDRAPSSPEIPRTPSTKKKLSHQELKVEYIELKKKELEDRDVKHKEMVALIKERNAIERTKCELFERYLERKGY